MAGDREQRDKLMELMGEGSTRRIRLIIFAVLTLSGIAAPGVGVLVCNSAGRERVGCPGYTGLGFRRWRLDADRGPGPGARVETSEGHAGRVGPRSVRRAQLYKTIEGRTKCPAARSYLHLPRKGQFVRHARAGTALSPALEEPRGTGARVAHYVSFTGESIDGTGTVTETSFPRPP